MTIGDRIRYLRKKKGMRQEDLAACLCVSYQAVSKWECNLSSPDLGLIGPLTKLLGVTSDELLGLTEEDNDERKAFFDSEYKGYWKRADIDLPAIYEIAKSAVEEYPGNLEYLKWLASMEYIIAFDDNYRNGVPYEQLTHFNEMMDKAIRHSLTVYENSENEELRDSALWNLILCYKHTNRPDEARYYASLYPDKSATTRDDAMLLVLTGEERVRLTQKMLIDLSDRLCRILNEFKDDCHLTEEAECFEETFIRALVPDGNYLGLAFKLFYLRIGQAVRAAKAGDKNSVLRLLKEAAEFGKEYDRAVQDGTMRYTAPLLKGYVFLDPEYNKRNFTCVGEFRDQIASNVFDPFRNYPEFMEILHSTEE